MTQQSACESCNITGLPIFPLVYAVLPLDLKPTLPPGITANGVKDIVVNQHPRVPSKLREAQGCTRASSSPALEKVAYDYGLRVVRAGYIYLFYELGPLGSKYWNCYTVNDDGCMTLQADAESPTPPRGALFCLNKSHTPLRTHYLVIDKPDKCGRVWIAYSEHQWTRNTIKKYENDQILRAMRMQFIEPAELIASPIHDHGVEATVANLSHVMEYCKETDEVGRKNIPRISLDDGDFSDFYLGVQPSSFTFNSRLKQEVSIVKQMQLSGVRPDGKSHPPMMLALWDHLGVAQELAGWCNLVSGLVGQYQENECAQKLSSLKFLEGTQKFLEEAAEKKVYKSEQDHVVRLNITEDARRKAEKLSEPQKGHHLEIASLSDQWESDYVPVGYRRQLSQILRYSDLDGWDNPVRRPALEAKRDAALNKLKAEVKDYQENHRLERNRLISQRRAESWPKYKNLIDWNSLNKFKRNHLSFLDVCDALNFGRTEHLLKWLRSKQLTFVLNDFDKNELSCGVSFERIVGALILGLGNCDAGSAQLDAWVKELNANAEGNLFWRAFSLNNTDISREVNAALSLASSKVVNFTKKDFEDSLASIKIFKTAADLYKKAVTLSNTNQDAGKGKTVFGIKLKTYNAYKLDRVAISVGDRAFKLFRIEGVHADSVGEWMVRHMYNVRALVDPADSMHLISAATESRIKNMLAAESVMRARRLADQQAGLDKNYSKSVIDQKNAPHLPEQNQALFDKAYAKRAEEIQQSIKNKSYKLPHSRHYEVFLELEGKILADKSSEVSKQWDKIYNDKGASDSIKAIKDCRLALVVTTIEAINLSKLLLWDVKHEGKTDAKTGAFILASLMSIGSGVADVASVVTKSAFGGESFAYQRLKLWGGGLSAGASYIGAVVDLIDYRKHLKKDEYGFAGLYLLKSMLGFASFGFTGMTTFAYAAPLIQRMTGTAVITEAATVVGARAVGYVAARVLFMVLGSWATALTIFVQIAIIMLDDDNLTKWCKRCPYGPESKTDPFSNNEKLVSAFKEAVADAE